MFIGTYDTRSIERITKGRQYCYRCQFINNSQAQGCLIHLHGNSIDTPPLIVLSSLRLSFINNTLSEWSCYEEGGGVNIQWIIVYDIEKYRRTSVKPAMILSSNELPPLSLPIDISTSTVNALDIMTTSLLLPLESSIFITPSSLFSEYSTFSSQPPSIIHLYTSPSLSSSPSPSPYTTSTSHYINTTPNNASPSSSSSSTYIPAALGGAIGISIIIVISMGLTLVLLITCIRRQKGNVIWYISMVYYYYIVRIRDLQMRSIATSINPIYSSTTSPYQQHTVGDTASNDKLITAIDLPITNNNNNSHIYSEVKKNEWIPNPTYGHTAMTETLQIPPSTTTTFGGVPENKIYDSPKHQPIEVPVLTACPAYDQPPLLPSARQIKH